MLIFQDNVVVIRTHDAAKKTGIPLFFTVDTKLGVQYYQPGMDDYVPP